MRVRLREREGRERERKEGKKGEGEKRERERKESKDFIIKKFNPQTCVTIKLKVHVQHVTYTLVMSFLFLKSFKLSSDKFPLPLPSSREDSNSLTVSVTEST